MTTIANWIGLRLDPLDTLFFRDGRPFDAANRVVGGLPTPQTLAGAIRTALLGASGFFAKEENRNAGLKTILDHGDKAVTGAEFRGPFLALANDHRVEPLFETPLVLTKDKNGNWIRRAPCKIEVPGWQDADGLRPLLWDGEPDPKAELPWLTLGGLNAVLSGGAPDGTQAVEKKSLTEFDNRTGIVIDTNSLSAVEGQLYGIRLLALNPQLKSGDWKGWKVCLYAEIKPGNGGTLDCGNTLNGLPIPFGGEGRYVQAATVEARAWPTVDSGRPSALWYLATPSFLPRSAKSKRPLPPNVAAAASGAGVAVSGWDVVRRGPNATRFGVPAGACYFLHAAGSNSDFLDHTLTDSKNLHQSGWGFALQGKWEDPK